MMARVAVIVVASLLAACGAAPTPAPTPAPAPVEPPPVESTPAPTLEESQSVGPAPLSIEPGEELIEAKQAYNLGDPVRAVRILELIAADDPRRTDGAELEKKARADVDAIAADWLRRIDGYLAKRQYRMAQARGLYLLDHFPVSAEVRAAIEQKLRSVESGVAEARVSIRQLRAEAADQLLRHDFVGGLRTLRRAEAMARKFDFRDALDIERQMAAAEFRFAQERLPVHPTPDRGRKPPKSSRKRRSDKPDKTNGRSPPPEEETESPRSKEVQDLLRAGSRHRKKRNYHDAIVAFDNVRHLDPENGTAKAALESLTRRRQELIKSYLARANGHLLKQDLEGARPLFLKVRELDPENEEAIEGIEMYRNLERIRRQRQ
jgi:tetratricopeptide (TPR) repeat protein